MDRVTLIFSKPPGLQKGGLGGLMSQANCEFLKPLLAGLKAKLI